ncbi:MAG: hypothetical protein AB7O67_05520 [Vicinamibacterales bacterium]
MKYCTFLTLLCLLVVPAAAAAQEHDHEPDARDAAENVSVAPISCWWQSSTPAVRVGERFRLTLTCAALEDETARVVPDESRLEPSALQIPPFEVAGGERGDDLQTATRRFFQYGYDVSVIVENAFGADLSIPALEISYTVETSTGTGEAMQGREQTYVMPPLPIKVLSLVPVEGGDIRDVSGAPSLAAIEGRQSTAALLRTIALVLFVLSGVMIVVALAGAARRRLATTTTERSLLLPPRTIVGALATEMAEVGRLRAIEGWTPAVAGRALAATRVAAAIATGATVGQQIAAGTAPLEGQVAITTGFPRSRTVFVSAGTTASRVPAGDPLADALRTFTAARYGRDGSGNDGALDDAFDTAQRTVARLRSEHTMVAEALAAVRRGISGAGTRAWSR